MTFDEAIDFCLAYKIEIDPETPDKSYKSKGLTRLEYCSLDKEKDEYIRVVKVAKTLVEAVEQMQQEIGKDPKVGIFVK